MNGPEVILLVGVLQVAGGALASRIHLPAPVVWLLAGVTVGFIPGVDHVELPPEAVLLVFLPAILYWESLVDDCGPNETPDSLLRRDAELEAELRSALLADKRNAVSSCGISAGSMTSCSAGSRDGSTGRKCGLADSALEDD